MPYILCLILAMSMHIHCGGYHVAESFYIKQRLTAIHLARNGPMQIQIDDQPSCLDRLRKNLESIAHFFGCIKSRQRAEEEREEHERILIQPPERSQSPVTEFKYTVRQLEYQRLIELLNDPRSDSTEVKELVVRRVDPYAQVTLNNNVSVVPLIYCMQALRESTGYLKNWSKNLHILLEASRERAQTNYADRGLSDTPSGKEVRDLIKQQLGEFGETADPKALAACWPIWLDVCKELGANIMQLRGDVFSLVRQKGLVAGDYKIVKKMRNESDSFNHFATACIVYDFVYHLASCLATHNVYDMVRYCALGEAVLCAAVERDKYIAIAEDYFGQLNAETQKQVDFMVRILRAPSNK